MSKEKDPLTIAKSNANYWMNKFEDTEVEIKKLHEILQEARSVAEKYKNQSCDVQSLNMVAREFLEKLEKEITPTDY